MGNKYNLLLVIVILLTAIPTVAGDFSEKSENPCEDAEKYTVEDIDEDFGLHMTYSVQFLEREKQACIRVKNKGEMAFSSQFGLWVDGIGFSSPMPDLDGGESAFVSKNVTNYIDTVQDNHTVRVFAAGKNFTFDFTQAINESSPRVPTPYISNIHISRSRKTPKIVATVHNPGERAYGIHVRAETFETHSEVEVGAPQPGNSSEYTLELNESPSDVIAGKVMVYDDINQSDGKFDQKEFMAKPNETANAWDDHFEQVPGGTVDSSYSNETARQYREGYVNDEALSPFERRAGAVLVVLVAVGAVLWRRSN